MTDNIIIRHDTFTQINTAEIGLHAFINTQQNISCTKDLKLAHGKNKSSEILTLLNTYVSKWPFYSWQMRTKSFQKFPKPILEEKLNSFSTYLIVFSLIAVSEYKDANVNN